MNFYQKKNKNEISMEIKAHEIVYTLKDDTINKTDKIPFESILNDKYEIFESNKSFKNNAIYTAVVGTIFFGINIFYGTSLWAGPFLLAAPIFYFLYHRSKASFTVIKSSEGVNLLVIKDKSHDEIIDGIYSNRNQYLKENYLEINYENDPNSEINKFAWLKEQGLVSEKEFVVIREEIESNIGSL